MVFIIILYCIIFHRSGSASGSTYHFVLYPLLVLIFFFVHITPLSRCLLLCCGAGGSSRQHDCSWNVNV